MSKTKNILMWISAILMIVSGITTLVLCCIAIFDTSIIADWTAQKIGNDVESYDSVRNMFNWLISIGTAGSVVGIVFGGISIKFCTYSSLEFYQKKSVVLTVAIICTIIVNPVVGALYIYSVCMKDDNLNLDFLEEEPKKDVDLDKVLAKLEKLNKMKEQNLINEDEFNKLKSDIIMGTSLDSSKKKPVAQNIEEEIVVNPEQTKSKNKKQAD